MPPDDWPAFLLFFWNFGRYCRIHVTLVSKNSAIVASKNGGEGWDEISIFWAESDIKINPKSFNLRQRALIKPFVVHIRFGIMKKTVAYFIAFIVSFAVSTLMDYLIGDTVTVGDIATACINGIILLILIEMVVRKTSEK